MHAPAHICTQRFGQNMTVNRVEQSPFLTSFANMRGHKATAIVSWPVLFMTGSSVCHDESLDTERKRFLNQSSGMLAECFAFSLGENKTALPPH